jgi:hypothetical protein
MEPGVWVFGAVDNVVLWDEAEGKYNIEFSESRSNIKVGARLL